MTFKKLLFALLIFALVGSLALNYLLYKKAFVPLQSAKLDPIGLNYYPSGITQDKQADVPSVMFYGDSRALSWPTYKTSDYQFINRAIGNQTSTQIVQRFQAHAAPHKPDLILVQMCVNDIKMIPLFPENRDRIIQDCKDNIQSLIKQARKIEANIVLTTVFPLGDISIIRKTLGTTEAPIKEGIAEVNAFINTLAANDISIFDSYGLLAGENRKINPEYSRDWLHLNGEGYKRLNADLKDFLDQAVSNN